MIKFFKGSIKKSNLVGIRSSFKNLPEDKYLKFADKNFRNRRLAKILFKNNKFYNIDNTDFKQNKVQNRYLGGVNRNFQPINTRIVNKINKIVKENFIKIINFKKIKFGYHQIRITCGENYVGYPVPEGWHKDGFDFVALINISSKNIQGGISRIRNSIKENKDVDNYSCFLNSGEFLFFSDKDFFHFTDPIIVSNNKKFGYRDTIVITFKVY